MLTQTEADTLIAMQKRFLQFGSISIPPGIDESHELVAVQQDERFLFDIWRGTLRLSKLKFQTRGRQIIVLVRLDIDGSPHTNPDGTTLGRTHLHLYREGYEDKWAYPVNPQEFQDLADIEQAFTDFCAYCNIAPIPSIQEHLL